MSVRPVVPFPRRAIESPSLPPPPPVPLVVPSPVLFLSARREALPRKLCAMRVPKVHSAIMHSVRGHAPAFFLLVFHPPPLPPPRGFSPARIPRSPCTHPCDRCTTAVLSLCAVIFIFSFAENTQSDITDPETTRHSPESGVGEGRERGRRRWRWRGVGRNGEERHGATENIYVRAVDKITANLHARRLAFAKLSFPLNRWVLLLPTDNPAGRVDRFAGSSLYYRGLWRCIEMHETCTPRRLVIAGDFQLK